MKAAVFEGPEQFFVREVPDPKPEPGGVLLRVRACAICGTDQRIYRYGDPKLTPPMITGHECAGEVVELGEGTTGLKVGDRVVVAPPAITCGECYMCKAGYENLCLNRRGIGYKFPGGFAEFCAIPAQAVREGVLLPIPEHMSFAHAAITEPLACVVNGQKPLDIGEGDTVVVIGAGAIGLMHGQLARAKGASRVFIIDVSPKRLEMAESHGFDRVIDGSATDPVEEVMRLTDGRGASVAITATTANVAAEQAVEMVGKRGRVSFFAGLPKTNPKATINANRVHYFEISIFGASASSKADNRAALNYLSTGAVKAETIITHRFPLDEIIPAMEKMRRGETLKIVIEP